MPPQQPGRIRRFFSGMLKVGRMPVSTAMEIGISKIKDTFSRRPKEIKPRPAMPTLKVDFKTAIGFSNAVGDLRTFIGRTISSLKGDSKIKDELVTKKIGDNFYEYCFGKVAEEYPLINIIAKRER